MKISNTINLKISGKGHIFRCLAEKDVCEEYIQALREQNEFIENTKTTLTIKEQSRYVRRILNSDKETIFGLFQGNRLIGTAGVQNLLQEGTERRVKLSIGDTADTTMGVFIFPAFRGTGLGRVTIWSACRLLFEGEQLKVIRASVLKRNITSMSAFKKVGFVITAENDSAVNMEAVRGALVTPSMIESFRFETVG